MTERATRDQLDHLRQRLREDREECGTDVFGEVAVAFNQLEHLLDAADRDRAREEDACYEDPSVEDLLARAENRIGTLRVPADVLKRFLRRLNRAEEQLVKRVAILRLRENVDDKRSAPGGFATLRELDRTAREHAGACFANMAATVGLLRHLFDHVRGGRWDQVRRIADTLNDMGPVRP